MKTEKNDVSAKTDGIRVLLVDDEKGYINVLSNRLKKRKFHVTTACSGRDAIKAVRGQDFDIAILDLKMEDMDGIEVLKVFNQMDLDMKVIMLTGHGSQEAAREGIKLGAVDYLTKPCELIDLVNKINEAYADAKNISTETNK